MELSQNKFEEIKSVIQKFIDDKAFSKREDHVQTFYTVKILEILGWTSDKTTINTQQVVKTGERPDILLRGDGGGTIFIVESKEPSKSLDGKYKNKTFVEQLCQYCNSEGIYWGILTNFIEWRVYNSYRGDIYDDKGKSYKINTIVDGKLNNDESLYFFFNKITYDNLNKCKGKIDLSSIYYKKQEEIKNEFFVNLKLWRSKLRNYLYKNALKKNKEDLSEKCDYITQKILDRMIFMEVCNDKGIISYDVLGSILYSKKNKYEELQLKFKNFDDKFNSELFAEDEELDKLKIDDEPMEEIIRGINKIDFSNLSPQIIGEVYENYLGELLKKSKEKINVVDSKQKAKRKEQGIYYTPDYIVNYIVENTLGEILKSCDTHEDIEKIRVLDPACGSGSFLIRAFDEFYKSYERCRKEYGLFDEFEIKKKILLYNLFGVDLDERAVEIAKLNLLIKALEGTSDSSLEGKRKLLPNLNLNIRCGNSLISGKSIKEIKESDIIEKDILTLTELKDKFRNAVEDLKNIYSIEEKINSKLNTDLNNYFDNIDKIKPLNYEVAFCEIFKDGGFDCVIGNPPYVKEYTSTEIFKDVVKTNIKKYYQGKMDIWYMFACKSIDLLKYNGLHSFIAQNNWITSYGASILRNKILSETEIISFFDFNTFRVFKEAGIQTMIYVIKKSGLLNNFTTNYFKIIDKKINGDGLKIYLNNQTKNDKIINFTTQIKPLENINKSILFINNQDNKIINEIFNKGNYFLSNNNVAQGIVSPQESVIENHLLKIKDKNVKIGTGIFVITNEELRHMRLNKSEKDIIRPYYTSDQIGRYFCNKNNNYYIIYSDKEVRNNIKRYPNIKNHLDKFKKVITSDFGPYGLHRARDKNYFEGEKIISARKTILPSFCYSNFPCYVSQTYYIIKPNDINLKYLIGLLNSSLISYWLKQKGKKQGDLLQIDKEPLLNIPIYRANLNNENENSSYYKVIQLVEEIIVLYKNPIEYKIKIIAKDLEIDDEVYKLYGIDNEIREIIKKSLNK